MFKNVTIGADPELFIFDTTTKTVVSSIGMIPGEKGNPWVDPNWPEGFGLEIDNILAEFNIPPCSSKQEFVDNISFMKDYIRQFVKKINPNYDIRCKASYLVPEDQLQHPIAKILGCSIDYNVYTEAANPKPKGEATNLRSSGFHLHCGYPNPSVKESLQMIKYFDAYIGVISVLHDPDVDRRSLYGKAGCFRLASYGFEWRVLSSFFLGTKTKLRLIWDCIERALDAYEEGKPLPPAEKVINAINNSDKILALELINDYNLDK